jgi:hypothetical protein
VFVVSDYNVMKMEGLVVIPKWLNDDKGSCTCIIYRLCWMLMGFG